MAIKIGATPLNEKPLFGIRGRLASAHFPQLNLASMKSKSSARSLPKAPIGKDPLRPFSSIVLDGPDRAPSRAMLDPVRSVHLPPA
jgi:hypothetical protein